MEIAKDILTFLAASAVLSGVLLIMATILACIKYLLDYNLMV